MEQYGSGRIKEFLSGDLKEAKHPMIREKAVLSKIIHLLYEENLITLEEEMEVQRRISSEKWE